MVVVVVDQAESVGNMYENVCMEHVSRGVTDGEQDPSIHEPFFNNNDEIIVIIILNFSRI